MRCRKVLLRRLCLAIADPAARELPPNGLIEIATLGRRAQQRYTHPGWHAEILINLRGC
jgi:hypothetical protein